MKKKYAFYSSGGSSRIIKFYEQYDLVDYPISFIHYDGSNSITIEMLKILFTDKLITKKSISSNIKYELNEVLLYLMLKYNIDYLFCFGNKILKSPLIKMYKNKIINFHPSLLPAFPGLNSIDQALNSSVQILGNTAHFIDAETDTGPIIMQSVISRSAFREYEDVLNLQIDMLRTIWHLLDENKIRVKDNKVLIDYQINHHSYFSL